MRALPRSALHLLATLAAAAALACAEAPLPRPAAAPARPLDPVVELRPSYAMADAGWKKPSELEPGCVERTVLPPPGLQRIPEITVKFAVAPDGAVDRFEDISSPPAAPPVVAEVRRAIAKCDFVPGREPSGKLAYTWMILKVGPTRPR